MSVKLLKRRFPSGAVRLYLDINFNGRRRKEALGLVLDKDRLQNRQTLRMAEEIRAQRELSLQEQVHGVIQSNKRRKSFIDYYEQLLATKHSPHTRISWKNALQRFNAYAQNEAIFGQMTREFLEGFKTYLLETAELSPNSAQIYFSRIKSALNQAVRDRLIPNNPALGVTIKKIDRLPTYLTMEDLSKLVRNPCPNENVRAAFLFSCFTGLRYSDILALRWDQIGGEYMELTQQKTSAPMRQPLSKQAKQILEAQKRTVPSSRTIKRATGDLVFHLPRQSVIDKSLKKWARNTGIEKRISMHVGRHTFATLSLTSGIDIYTTSKLLGHKNLHSTQIYAKVIDEQKKRAVDLLPTLE